jgi:flagellar biosynthesis GTPase FlhF
MRETLVMFPMMLPSSNDIAAVVVSPVNQQSAEAREQAREQADQAREQAQEARQQAQEARQEAREAANDAREASREAAREQQQTPQFIIMKDGKQIPLEGITPEGLRELGLPMPNPVFVDNNTNDSAYAVGASAIFAAMVVTLVGMRYWFKSRVLRNTSAAIPSDVTNRLVRMETAIESVAVEVERISEGQRFTTRLLSERVREEVPRG